jgi:hypothetical protein
MINCIMGILYFRHNKLTTPCNDWKLGMEIDLEIFMSGLSLFED